jgi:hypothetical protein
VELLVLVPADIDAVRYQDYVSNALLIFCWYRE